MAGIEPHVETLRPWVSLGVRQVVPMAELGTAFPTAYEAVAKAAAGAGAALVGPAYAEYFGMPTDTVDVEIGFGVDRPLEVAGMTTTERSSTRAVVATHVGPYDKLEESYAALMPWLESQDLALTDSMFEFYDSDPEVDPAATVTRIVFPLG